MLRAAFCQLTPAVFVVFSLTAHASDLRVEGAEIGSSQITVTGYTIPEHPGGLPSAGASKATLEQDPDLGRLPAQLKFGRVVLLRYGFKVSFRTDGAESTSTPEYVTDAAWHDTNAEELLLTLARPLADGDVLIALEPQTGELTEVRVGETPDLAASAWGPWLEGFTEGAETIRIVGLDTGNTIRSIYTTPGASPTIILISDGSWGDLDGEANGVIETSVPRWSGPPWVLSGDMWTVAIEGETSPGIGTWTATGSGVRFVVPVVSHVIGASGVPFISDLTINNQFGTVADGWIRFVAEGGTWLASDEAQFTLKPGESMSWTDVLAEALGISDNTKGTLLVGGPPAWNLAVTSRNYAVDLADRRFGIAIPGESTLEPLTPDNLWVIPGLRQDAVFRGNLILAGALPTASRVLIRIFDRGGLQATREVTVPAFGLKQINRLGPSLGVSQIDDGSVEITVLEGGIFAGLSIVDGTADDAAYIRPRPVVPLR